MMQPRTVACLMLGTVYLLPCAYGRRQELYDGMLDVERVTSNRTAIKQAVKARSFIRANTWFGETLLGHEVHRWGGKRTLDVSEKILVRECVGERAQHFKETQERLGLTPKTPNNVDAPLKLIAKIYKADDKIQESKGVFSSFHSEVKQWNKDQTQAKEGLRKWGFDYDAAWDRCEDGATDDAYECMVESAESANLKEKVRQHIDASDLAVHHRAQRYFWNSKGRDETRLRSEIEELEKDLDVAGYELKDVETSCKKALANKVKTTQDRVLKELSAAEQDEEGICHEKQDDMCPEGTYATTARRWDMATGAAASGTGFVVAKFTLLPLGTLIGSAFGPAGATIGFFAANALVAPLAMAAGYFASRGPKECGCFPRECSYNATLGMCALDSAVESVSKNPFASKLTMSGMKCAMEYREEAKCSLSQCTLEDYEHGYFSDAQIYGTIGQRGKSLFNCLSTNPAQTNTLAAVPVLPDGQNNTIIERNKIFTQLLKPTSDE